MSHSAANYVKMAMSGMRIDSLQDCRVFVEAKRKLTDRGHTDCGARDFGRRSEKAIDTISHSKRGNRRTRMLEIGLRYAIANTGGLLMPPHSLVLLRRPDLIDRAARTIHEIPGWTSLERLYVFRSD